jgi:tetratricopeptide (TPR) repeat protein
MSERAPIKLDEAARLCLRIAQGRGRRRGSAELTPELLFLGIAGAEPELCDEVFEHTHELERTLLQRLPKGDPISVQGADLPLSPALEDLARRAGQLGLSRGNAGAGPIDLLFVLLQRSPVIKSLLAEARLSYQQALQTLAEIGGLPSPSAAEPICCGPMMLARLGLGDAFGRFVVRTLGDAADASAVRLLRLFSQLGPATVLLDEDRPQDCLADLAALRCPSCNGGGSAPLSADGAELVLCRSDCAGFIERNPGYAALADGRTLFRRHALGLALDANKRLVAHRLAQGDPDTDGARRAWQDGLAVATALDRQDELADHLVEVALGRADSLTSARRLDDAIRLLDQVAAAESSARLSGRLAEALTDRGVRAGNKKDFDGAIADLRRALAISPAVSRIRQNLAEALVQRSTSEQAREQRQAMLEEARGVLQEGLREDAHNQTYKRKLTMVEQLMELAADEPTRFDELVALTSSGADDLMMQAMGHFKREEWAQSEDLLRKAAELAPSSPKVLIQLSHTLVKLDKYAEAVGVQRRIAELDPGEQYSVLSNCAQFLTELGDYEQAEQEARRAIAFDPEKGDGYLKLGRLMQKRGRTEAAKDAYRKAAATDGEASLMATLLLATLGSEAAEAPASTNGKEGETGENAEESAEQLARKLAEALLGNGSDEEMSEPTRRVGEMLRGVELNFRRLGRNTLVLPFKPDHQASVPVYIGVLQDFMFMKVNVAEPEPEQQESVLRHWLRITHELDIFKVTRDADDGELAVVGEVPLSLLSPHFLKVFIRGLAHLGDLPKTALDNPELITMRGLQVARVTREALADSPDAPPKRGLLGRLLGRGNADADDWATVLPRLCAAGGWPCEQVRAGLYRIQLQTPLMRLRVMAICRARMLSLTAVFQVDRRSADPAALYRRMAELNLKMDICKITLDADGDRAYMVELPGVDEAAFRDAMDRIERYSLEGEHRLGLI